jgi:ribosomal protein S12 methylthiotransferase accessory factor
MSKSLHEVALDPAMVDRYPFLSLVRPGGGVVQSVVRLKAVELQAPRFETAVSALGNLTMAFPRIAGSYGDDMRSLLIGGAGADETNEMAVVRSVAEAAERYACCVLDERELITATFNELGDDGLDFGTLPVCSETEYADPRCPIVRPDPDQPIRWLQGYSITAGKRRYVPLVMTHLYVREWDEERFNLPITTGVAAHTDPLLAMVSAICEVVERDAISLTWLMRLALPRLLVDDSMPEALRPKFERLRRSGIEQHFFDATTDIGVPTAYGLQIKPGHPHVAQFVNCSTGFSMWDNCGKIIRESSCGRIVVEPGNPVPSNVADFLRLEDGAIYMGRPEHRHAFDFLTNTPRSIALGSWKDPELDSPAAQLRWLTERFKALGMDVVLLDLTTDELADAGLWVFRAVIPGLVPMTPAYRARFLGHPRLYSYPEQAGFGPRTEADINPFPQPFA